MPECGIHPERDFRPVPAFFGQPQFEIQPGIDEIRFLAGGGNKHALPQIDVERFCNLHSQKAVIMRVRMGQAETKSSGFVHARGRDGVQANRPAIIGGRSMACI